LHARSVAMALTGVLTHRGITIDITEVLVESKARERLQNPFCCMGYGKAKTLAKLAGAVDEGVIGELQKMAYQRCGVFWKAVQA
jgi:hypothetical protein